ncbi:MAG: class I SAM-dependent RNA methyltransferase [Candidatus Nanopelagicaceae bacterium]|nr:class I SAM-dependent RNA methyltransferase [Candidatus Nanopelagicaceae bacterium]
MQSGDQLEVDITAIAHGGHCIARYDGRVIFVRHAIPGERVIVEISDVTKSFARGNCISVIKASKHRVTPPCSFARFDGCGGCDFQHIDPNYQRELKREIIKEQFSRLAKMEIDVEVEEVKPNLHWRSRMEFTVSENSKVGLYASRSNQIVEIDKCLIAHEDIDIEKINQAKLPKSKRVDVAITSKGQSAVVIEGRENLGLIEEQVDDINFSLNPITFWQSHRMAPTVLSQVVRDYVQAEPADHIFDLYGGAGLFSAALLSQLGVAGRITLIESDENAIIDARRNFALEPRVEIVEAKVEASLKKYRAANVVLLDPPRAGAGERVISTITSLAPRTIVYVACDPAALARDSAYLAAQGYKLDQIRAFDLFPMTAHMELVARFIIS